MEIPHPSVTSQFAVLDTDELFIPAATSVSPFAGIPVASTGRPSLVTVVQATSYETFREHHGCSHGLDATHSLALVMAPPATAGIIGQLLSAANAAGWDMAELTEAMNRMVVQSDRLYAEAARQHAPWGLRL